MSLLPLNNESDLDTLIRCIGNARIVFRGEATHGTSEFYTWRAAITKKLIKEKGFRLIALEADWIDLYRLNNIDALQDNTDITKTLLHYKSFT